jgi:hypothetical protein
MAWTRGRIATPGPMKLPILALCLFAVACTRTPESVSGDASVADAPGEASDVVDEGGVQAADAGDGAVDAGSCTCAAAGTCDSFGCPPDYNDSTFATWCQTVQTSARGHVVSMSACGSLLLMTYGVDGGCDRGYAVEQGTGILIATLDQCGGGGTKCAELTPQGCLPACCLDKSCLLGVPSLCPAWVPDAGAADD